MPHRMKSNGAAVTLPGPFREPVALTARLNRLPIALSWRADCHLHDAGGVRIDFADGLCRRVTLTVVQIAATTRDHGRGLHAWQVRYRPVRGSRSGVWSR